MNKSKNSSEIAAIRATPCTRRGFQHGSVKSPVGS